MELALIIGVVGFLAGVPLVAVGYALAIGVRALRRADEAAGERRTALNLIGLNLCEPAVNSLVIGLLATTRGASVPRAALAVTLAMAVLLLPARLMRSPDELVARTADQLVAIGLGRWLWALLTVVFGLMVPFALPALVIPGSLILAMGARWGARRIPALLEPAGMSALAAPPAQVEPLRDARAGLPRRR